MQSMKRSYFIVFLYVTLMGNIAVMQQRYDPNCSYIKHQLDEDSVGFLSKQTLLHSVLKVRREEICFPRVKVVNCTTTLLIGYLAGSIFNIEIGDYETGGVHFDGDGGARVSRNASIVNETNKAMMIGSHNASSPPSKQDSLNRGSKQNNHSSVASKGSMLLDMNWHPLPHSLQGHHVSAAIKYAVDEINNDSIVMPNFKLEFIYTNTLGNVTKNVEALLDQWLRGVAVYIGPEETCQVEATIAGVLNIPMISFNCVDPQVSKKTKYPTFARTIPTLSQISSSVIQLLTHYNWKKFTLIHGRSDRSEQLADAISELSKRNRLKIQHRDWFLEPWISKNNDSIQQIARLVETTYKKTRIYVFCGLYVAMQMFMDELNVRGLFDQGEYFVVYVEPDYYYESADTATLRYLKPSHLTADEFIGSDRHKRAMYSARHLMVIIPTPVDLTTEAYLSFLTRVDDFNTQHPFYFPKHLQSRDAIDFLKKTPYASYLYDAVKLYALAAHEEMQAGGSYVDGRAIIRRIRNRKYKSLGGYDMEIDDNGDALGNYTLFSFQPAKVPGYFTHVLERLAVFTRVEEMNKTDVKDEVILPGLLFEPGLTTEWPNGTRPKDEPICGFDNEYCEKIKDITGNEIRNDIKLGLALAIPLGCCIILVVSLLLLIIIRQKRAKKIAVLLQALQEKLILSSDMTANVDPDYPMNDQIENISYDTRYEIPRERIQLGKLLGEGNFGKVLKGLLADQEGNFNLPVAVKVPKRPWDHEQHYMLLSELKMLIYIGPHVNVLALVGAITTYIARGELLVITEYCKQGCLLDHIRLYTESFVNEVIRQQEEKRGPAYYGESLSEYMSGTKTLYKAQVDPSWKATLKWRRLYSTLLCTSDLLSYCLQVTNGLQFLQSKNVLHRDLAARNLLLTADNLVKIGDFGLARQKSIYSMKTKHLKEVLLPVAWCSPEAIQTLKFSAASDVWSFGVLMWEIFSLGEQPYVALSDPSALLSFLRAGSRLSEPMTSPTPIYNLMLRCWSWEPEDRPSIPACRKLISDELHACSEELSVQLNKQLDSYSPVTGNPAYFGLSMSDQCIQPDKPGYIGMTVF